MSISVDQAQAREDRSAAIAVTGFPLFILAGAILAFFFPAPFLPLANYITYFLMIIMFAMGLTLTIPDFKEIARRPWPVFVGVVAQFVIMPLLAVAVAKLLGLNEMLTLGLLMLGSVPGGTSSNVIAYLAKGDVALSVAMTSVSTLVSPIMTPLLMLWLAGQTTEVDAAGMAWSLAQTVLLPVIGGLIIRYFFDGFVEKISRCCRGFRSWVSAGWSSRRSLPMLTVWCKWGSLPSWLCCCTTCSATCWAGWLDGWRGSQILRCGRCRRRSGRSLQGSHQGCPRSSSRQRRLCLVRSLPSCTTLPVRFLLP